MSQYDAESIYWYEWHVSKVWMGLSCADSAEEALLLQVIKDTINMHRRFPQSTKYLGNFLWKRKQDNNFLMWNISQVFSNLSIFVRISYMIFKIICHVREIQTMNYNEKVEACPATN